VPDFEYFGGQIIMYSLRSSLASGVRLMTRTPLHLSAIAVVFSGIITTLLVGFVVDWELSGIITGLFISTACSGPASYLTGRYFFSVRDRLAAKNDEMMEVNRDLDAFSQTVAHDLKNPISNMLGYVEVMLEMVDDMQPAELRKYLERIQVSGWRTVAIIDELLLLAQIRNDNVQKSTVDMQKTIALAQERLQNLIEERDAGIHVADDLPPVLGYAPWVEEIWANYLSNSIKYGGKPPAVHIGATPEDDGMIRFWIQDNGPGIAQEDQQRLFREFTRLEQHQKMADGSGLGLSIVQRIADKLGGRVGVESTPGEGSLFYFTLPSVEHLEA
jgi:signal transduction histidine kinase